MNEQRWKDKTCEKCVYSVKSKCRRLPPICWGTGFRYRDIRKGFWEDKFMDACAEYKENV